MLNKNFIASVSMGIALLLVGGCVIEVDASDWDDSRRDRHRDNGHDINKVFGAIRVGSGDVVGDVDSVNGSITMGNGSTGEDLEAVNGSINIQDNVKVESVETVNGSIRAGEQLQVRDDLSTVNGTISLSKGSTVGGDVSTVNGSIKMHGTTVEVNVTTLNGDIEVLHGSNIAGDIVFEERHRRDRRHQVPELVVDSSSVIEGDIHLYQEVDLRIDDDAKVGKIYDHYHDS